MNTSSLALSACSGWTAHGYDIAQKLPLLPCQALECWELVGDRAEDCGTQSAVAAHVATTHPSRGSKAHVFPPLTPPGPCTLEMDGGGGNGHFVPVILQPGKLRQGTV